MQSPDQNDIAKGIALFGWFTGRQFAARVPLGRPSSLRNQLSAAPSTVDSLSLPLIPREELFAHDAFFCGLVVRDLENRATSSANSVSSFSGTSSGMMTGYIAKEALSMGECLQGVWLLRLAEQEVNLELFR